MIKPMLSASMMCANLLRLQEDLDALAESGVEYLHIDVMDSHFVPNLMLYPDFTRVLRQASRIPLDIHLMVEQPERVLPMFPLEPGDIVSIHYESTPHVHRAVLMVRERGAAAALALNPGTPIECAREFLEDIQFVLLMTVNPGFAGQKLVSNGIEKIRRMRAYLDGLGWEDILLEVDGNCSFENAPKMLDAGGRLFVVGSSSIFKPSLGILKAVEEFRNIV